MIMESPLSNVLLNFSVIVLAALFTEHPETVGPVSVPFPPYAAAIIDAARRRPTGSLSRGWMGPMKKCVSELFSIRGARGRRSRFQSASDAFQRQLALARAGPHLQHGGGGAVPLLVHVQACYPLEASDAFVEQMSPAEAHGSFRS